MLFVLAVAGRAHAAPFFYDNGAPNQANGNEMTAWIQAEDFLLGSSTTLTGVRFWDVEQAPSYQGSITWQIYDDGGGMPGTSLYSGTASPIHSATGNVLFFGNEFQNDFGLPNIALGAGTYWLALHNGPLTTMNRLEFYWETTDPNSTLSAQEDPAPFIEDWSSNGQEHAFQLFGETGAAAVPEPTTMLLVGTGLAAAIRQRRRKQNS